MKKFFTLLLLIGLNFSFGLLTNAENSNINSCTRYGNNLSDENIGDLLKNLNLQSLNGEFKRNNIYILLKNYPQVLNLFEPATGNSEKISDILGKYGLRNHTNDFYIVLNKILKEKINNNRNKVNITAFAS